MRKIAIVGSRDYIEEGNIADFISTLPEDVEIVSGGADGVDSWAIKHSGCRPTKVFPAEWDLYGKGAGMRRNSTIVDYADEVYAFWNGLSRGTLDTIQKAAKAGKLKGIFVK
jgi:hypothetical protein